jgi:hypothetical protein
MTQLEAVRLFDSGGLKQDMGEVCCLRRNSAALLVPCVVASMRGRKKKTNSR